MHRLTRAAIAAVVLTWPRGSTAEEIALTLDEALALARGRAPTLLSARARVGEARGRLAGASVLLRDNPVLDAGVGRRTSDRGEFVESEIGLSQTFELGGRRGARVASAEAGVALARADGEEAARLVLREVAVAFYRGLHAEERVRLALAAEGLAGEILRSAERRHTAGEVPILDVNVARAALARTRSDRSGSEALREAALGELRLLLGMGTDALALRGDLRDRRRLERGDLPARAHDRPDLRALDAELREADADARLGDALAWPELGLGGAYEREEGASVALGRLALTLPLFERGQGQRAEAAARARRVRLERDAGQRAIGAEVRTAEAVYRRRVEAAEALERALPLLDENEALARRSYESGALGLAELLLVRRESLETRKEYLDRLLEAVVGGIELEASAGVLR